MSYSVPRDMSPFTIDIPVPSPLACLWLFLPTLPVYLPHFTRTYTLFFTYPPPHVLYLFFALPAFLFSCTCPNVFSLLFCPLHSCLPACLFLLVLTFVSVSFDPPTQTACQFFVCNPYMPVYIYPPNLLSCLISPLSNLPSLPFNPNPTFLSASSHHPSLTLPPFPHLNLPVSLIIQNLSVHLFLPNPPARLSVSFPPPPFPAWDIDIFAPPVGTPGRPAWLVGESAMWQ